MELREPSPAISGEEQVESGFPELPVVSPPFVV